MMKQLHLMHQKEKVKKKEMIDFFLKKKSMKSFTFFVLNPIQKKKRLNHPPQLLKKIKPPKEVEDEEQKKIRSSKVKSAVPLVVLPIEDMFDRCWEIHNRVGKHGRESMEVESKIQYYSSDY
jgi:hypothetical protein